MADGAPSGNNACAVCNPSISTTGYSAAADGSACATGKVCSGGSCASACFIGGSVVAANAPNPANACQYCAPSTSTTAWTLVGDGAMCGGGQICQSGACGSGCTIGGTNYASGQINPMNACQACNPGSSTTAWTDLAGGTGCGAGNVCNGSSCQAGCWIDGTFRADGAVNPANACQVCSRGQSTSAWSTLANGAECAPGQVCNGGACSTGCWIDSAFRASGSVNPANPCQVCLPDESVKTWSNRSAGTTCAADRVCSAGSCQYACFISNTLVGDGAYNPANACERCNPGNSINSWTAEPEGAECGSIYVCHNNSCTHGCFADGAYRGPGSGHPSNPCLFCDPSQNLGGWSARSNGTDCDDGEACNGVDRCNGGSCVQDTPPVFCDSPPECHTTAGATCSSGTCDYPAADDGTACSSTVCVGGVCNYGCWLGGSFYSAGEPTDGCYHCDPQSDPYSFTYRGDWETCGSGLICCYGACDYYCM